MNAPQWLIEAILIFNDFVILYFLSLNTIYLFFFILSLSVVYRFVRRSFFSDYGQIAASSLTWPVSIIVPAHNESMNIVDTIRSLTMLSYSEFEIIVVNDGSTDDTLTQLIDTFRLRRTDRVYRKSLETRQVRGVYTSLEHANLVIIDKDKGGKADALNCGINLSRYPLFCSIDADSIIEDNALLRLVKPFMDHPEETVAAGGIVRIVNGCKIRDGRVSEIRLSDRALPTLQAVEYLRAFLTGRVGWSALQSLMIISGAFGVYRKSEIIRLGGYDLSSDTEDLELVVRLHRQLRLEKRKYRVVFIPDPVCWTEVPTTVRVLARQRNRWHRGLVHTLWTNRGMMFNPRYGTIGMFAFPYFFVFEMLGPVVEILGYIALILGLLLGIVNMQFFLLFLCAAILYGVFLSVAAVLLEELAFRRYPSWLDLTKLLFFGIVENFGYRQMLSLFKVKGFLDFLLRRGTWGRMERTGFNRVNDQPITEETT
jgi:cellulose synthase/poly-beta-1,6-N-acetylglucosamine synthase-like glycosyltransferase